MTDATTPSDPEWIQRIRETVSHAQQREKAGAADAKAQQQLLRRYFQANWKYLDEVVGPILRRTAEELNKMETPAQFDSPLNQDLATSNEAEHRLLIGREGSRQVEVRFEATTTSPDIHIYSPTEAVPDTRLSQGQVTAEYVQGLMVFAVDVALGPRAH
jgi:hypothetical protein